MFNNKNRVRMDFMFTDEQLANTPSRRIHKVEFDEEMILRRCGTAYIRELAARITSTDNPAYRKKTRVMAVAMVYFHRFYMYHSFRTFKPIPLATACFFLAAKCEDCPRRLKELSCLWLQITNPNATKPTEEELEAYNDLTIDLETALLRTLAFELLVELPHIEIISARFEKENLKKMAYFFATEMLAHSTLCLQYDSKILAAACYHFVGCYLNIDMQKEFGVYWFRTFRKDIDEIILSKVCLKLGRSLLAAKHLIGAEILRPSIPPVIENRNSQVNGKRKYQDSLHQSSYSLSPWSFDNGRISIFNNIMTNMTKRHRALSPFKSLQTHKTELEDGEIE